jgi:hypothetical protein
VITAVHSSVLIDVPVDDPRFGDASTAAVRFALSHGAVVACDFAWAELLWRDTSGGLIAQAIVDPTSV